MKLLTKILLIYFSIVSILGGFSTYILIYDIEKKSNNLDAYREREITSFAKVIDAFIPNKEALKNIEHVQQLFVSTVQKLPHVKRLTLHTQDVQTMKYTHIASSVPSIIGTPSHKEDVDAILQNKSTLLYETNENGDRYLDITYPILNTHGQAIAALGIAVSLRDSDQILQKAKEQMYNDAIDTVIFAIIMSMILALIVAGLISRRIIAPITTLKKAAKNISNSSLNTMIEIDSEDEIGELSKEFNKMTKKLNSLHLSMEEKIDTKTKELEKQFLQDSLTGLQNRNALFKSIKQLQNFHVAILDISAFKNINDAYGIDIGNAVLKELSKKYTSYLIHSDLKLFRLSGDEMAILNPDILSQEEFTTKMDAIIKKIEHETFYFEKDDVEINISIHAGISYDTEHAIEKANIALIKAKKSHVNYMVFNKEEYQDNEQRKNIKTIAKIKHALDNRDIIVHYQAIVDRARNIVKYEALVRMREGDKILSPYFFLDASKKTKYYKEITKSVLSMAFDEFHDRDEKISVNICLEDIISSETQEFIKEKLLQSKKPQNIVFELVESEDIHELPELKTFIKYIKKSGAKIAIDDFGTGYSNFAYLMDLEPDYLKIDGSLIKNIDKDKRSYDIVKTIVSFAHGLNIKVIAEFIHSEEVLKVCEELEVDEFQGYYFSEPSAL